MKQADAMEFEGQRWGSIRGLRENAPCDMYVEGREGKGTGNTPARAKWGEGSLEASLVLPALTHACFRPCGV